MKMSHISDSRFYPESWKAYLIPVVFLKIERCYLLAITTIKRTGRMANSGG